MGILGITMFYFVLALGGYFLVNNLLVFRGLLTFKNKYSLIKPVSRRTIFKKKGYRFCLCNFDAGISNASLM